MIRPVLLMAFVGALLGACSGDNHPDGGHHSAPPECQELSMRCHAFDMGSGVAHECHELGHSSSSTAEMCTAKRAECLAACPEADAGADAATDAAADGN
jgi:hypothetical protein